ncbi:hypothetical protein [Kitasatospora sp. NPDC058190]|uniref:hypothetical protein n=1 Tax=Kitasatospora sp. NPDC058190 TaxID=3346371 RepID=UPI0036D86754
MNTRGPARPAPLLAEAIDAGLRLDPAARPPPDRLAVVLDDLLPRGRRAVPPSSGE